MKINSSSLPKYIDQIKSTRATDVLIKVSLHGKDAGAYCENNRLTVQYVSENEQIWLLKKLTCTFFFSKIFRWQNDIFDTMTTASHHRYLTGKS